MEEPPPTTHTLRPHHVCLLSLIHTVFKYQSRNRFTAAATTTFLLHVYRVIMHEVAEVGQPSTYQGLMSSLFRGPDSNTEGARAFMDTLAPAYLDFVSVDQMTNFFNATSYLFVDPKGDMEPELYRRSLLGYFCRRSYVSFIKLSYAGVIKLRRDYHHWLAGYQTGYEHTEKDLITYDRLVTKTHADEYEWAQPAPYASFERGITIADTNLASESLRRFFEQHFHDGNDSGVRQHALLNLSRMHYLRHEFVATRKFLTEAIDIARTANDTETLQHCQSLLHRLPPLHKKGRLALNEIQPGLHPLEVLFDVEKLTRVSSEQPLSAAFEKIAQANGLYDHWIDVQGHSPDYAEQWSQHAVQSFVWSVAGCHRLAAIEEDIVTAFGEIGGDDNNVLTVNLNRAYRRARQGQYQPALAMLLEPDVWRGLNMSDYVQWASQIWHILVLRATRRGQDRLYLDFLRPRRPSSPFNSKDYSFVEGGSPTSIIRDPLYETMRLRQADQGAVSVERLLRAIWHAEFQCRYGSYRTGIILLADVGLEFGMSKRCRKIIEEILPQIINGDDLEQRALGCFTYARCIIAAENRSSESIREAMPYLAIAEKDYSTLEILRSLADVQYLVSVLYHNLEMEEERDQAAKRHLETEEERKREAIATSEDWVSDVWALVCDVGLMLAAR